MVNKTKKPQGIEKAAGLKPTASNIRVVMPNPIANAVHSAVGQGNMPSLRYSVEEENKSTTMNWYQLEDFSNTVAEMIGSTAQEFQSTINLINSCKHVVDMARFSANVTVTMADLQRFTDEFMSVKAKHEGKNGIIEEAADRMAFLAIFEDYRALSAYFQGTMHHKLIEFTEYALDAKDKLLELEKEEATAAAATEVAVAPETPIEETTHE